jgi:hypothetical protein
MGSRLLVAALMRCAVLGLTARPLVYGAGASPEGIYRA